MIKFVPFALLILGMIVMAYAFLYGSGNALPYQDPTPEMLAYQAAEATRYCITFAFGALAATFGGGWLWRRTRVKKRNGNAQ
jgi:hypothetical protein